MLRIELKALRPGYASFKATKWQGSDNNLQIAVQESQQARYLAGDDWVVEPAWFQVPDLRLEGESLVGELGPWLIDPLVKQVGNVQYRLSVRNEEGKLDMGVLRLSPDILASSASGNTARDEDVRTVAQPDLEPEPEVALPVSEPVEEVVEEPVIESEPEPQVETPPEPTESVMPTKKSKLGLVIGLVVLLLIIAGVAAWFLLFNKSAPTAKSECSIESVGNDEMAFIQTCLKTKPDSAKILEVIEAAKANNHCSVAQRLYANQAQSGNAEIALAYAKEYEEGTQSPCFKADKETAIYWYETALEAKPDLAEAKQRLEELKK